MQNVSSAVKQQRHEAHDSLDDFPTPCFATRALIEHVLIPHMGLSGRREIAGQSVWEPACNRGYMTRPLAEYFNRAHSSDIFDYGVNAFGAVQDRVVDFLFPGSESPMIAAQGVDWIISNPPFRLAQQFIERSMTVPGWRGTAMIVRTAFLEGADRYKKLFAMKPPTIIAQFAERVVMTKGIVRDPSKPYWDEAAQKMRRPSTATAYCWLVYFANARRGTQLVWIPPSRVKLERKGDYPS